MKTTIDILEVRRRTVSISQYIDHLEEPFKEKFLVRKSSYALDNEAMLGIRETAAKYLLIVFCAAWCKDCIASIPVLAQVSETTGLEVRVFGGLKKDPLSHTTKWRIPPSPPEVKTFNIEKIPTILVINSEGNEIARITENAKRAPTLEQELHSLLET